MWILVNCFTKDKCLTSCITKCRLGPGVWAGTVGSPNLCWVSELKVETENEPSFPESAKEKIHKFSKSAKIVRCTRNHDTIRFEIFPFLNLLDKTLLTYFFLRGKFKLAQIAKMAKNGKNSANRIRTVKVRSFGSFTI